MWATASKTRGIVEPAILAGIDRTVSRLAARADACNLNLTRNPQAILPFNQFNETTADMAEPCDTYP